MPVGEDQSIDLLKSDKRQCLNFTDINFMVAPTEDKQSCRASVDILSDQKSRTKPLGAALLPDSK